MREGRAVWRRCTDVILPFDVIPGLGLQPSRLPEDGAAVLATALRLVASTGGTRTREARRALGGFL